MTRINFPEPHNTLEEEWVKDYVCLERLFPDERNRPSLAWLWRLKKAQRILCRRVGRLIFYRVSQVRSALGL